MASQSRRSRITEKLDRLEQALRAQQHLEQPENFLDQLVSLQKFSRLMSEEDRDFFHCAVEAYEEQMEWRIE